MAKKKKTAKARTTPSRKPPASKRRTGRRKRPGVVDPTGVRKRTERLLRVLAEKDGLWPKSGKLDSARSDLKLLVDHFDQVKDENITNLAVAALIVIISISKNGSIPFKRGDFSKMVFGPTNPTAIRSAHPDWDLEKVLSAWGESWDVETRTSAN